MLFLTIFCLRFKDDNCFNRIYYNIIEIDYKIASLIFRKIDGEGGTFVIDTACRNITFVVIGNFFADGKPDSGSFIFHFPVKPVKEIKNLFRILVY